MILVTAAPRQSGQAAHAIRGAEKACHAGPAAHPRERDAGHAVIDAARAEGVRHLVSSSVPHAITTGLVQHEIKRDIEEHLLSPGLEFTIFQPANYMLPLKLRPVSGKGVAARAPSGDLRGFTCATNMTRSCGTEACEAQRQPTCSAAPIRSRR